MARQVDLFKQPAPEPRCVACETPMVLDQRPEHIEPAYLCCNPHCSTYGKCRTCQMLVAWFVSVDTPAEAV